jgi:RHS repeat-associated protein
VSPLSYYTPKPYDKQPSVTNQLVITKPTDCECARLTALKNEFLSHGAGFSNFSAYLKSRYETVITQGALDTLAMLCNGTYTCIFLPAPIVLPPLLQCHGSNGQTVKPCINCKDFQVIKNEFFATFNHQAPVKEPVTQTDFAINTAFEKFANYKTGFSKNIAEYISFLDSCGGNSPAFAINPSCDSLKNILDSFYINYYNKPAYPIAYNAAGCDTSSWRFFRSPYVPFQNLFNNGIVSAPGGGFHFDYSHSICVPDSFVVTYRIKPLSIPNLSGQLYLPISLQTSAGATIFYIWLWNGGGKTQDNCDACGNPGIITSSSLSLNFNNWMDIAVKFRNSDGHVQVYINGNLVQDRTTIFTNITRVNGLSIQTFGNMEMLLDNVKVEKENSEIAYNETFDSACHKFAVINPKYDCSKLPCQQAFVNYFNSKKGTSYSFAQIDAQYFSTCGIHPAPCTPPGECNPLEELISNFQKIYIKPASGYVDYDLRTFAGNKTLDAGPKGVFDINKNLIGNTIDGTPVQIKQSYAQVWNSSQANQTVGTLSMLANGRFRLTLNQGQQAPCDGIIGMRFYQFDIPYDTLDAIITGLGTYIEFGDGQKIKVDSAIISTTSTIGKAYGSFGNTRYPFYYVAHIYPNKQNRTVTVYHTDTSGLLGFDNYIVGQANYLPNLKNLRGYAPQHCLTLQFHSTQDSSLNTLNLITNKSDITGTVCAHFFSGDNGFTKFKNYNFGSLQQFHDLRAVWLDDGATTATSLDNIMPNIPINFPNLYWFSSSYGLTYSPATNFSLPNLNVLGLGQVNNSSLIDSFLNQVGSSTLRDSGSINLYPAPRTSASDLAVQSLKDSKWRIIVANENYNPNVLASAQNDSAYNLERNYPLTNNFTEFYNQQYGTSYSYNQLMAVLKAQYGYTPDYCTLLTKTCGGDTLTSGPVLCGLNKPMYDTVHYNEDPCKDIAKFAFTAAEEKWQLYIDSLHNVFDTAYYNKCMGAKDLESFTVNYNVSEYHYTLYYYDQAGNLVKTVPPAGVDNKHSDAAFLLDVKAARLRVKNNPDDVGLAANIVTPVHTLETHYRYNTLNQVIAQKTPDAGISQFWYDRLGRLVVSQNAKQKTVNKYSYTLYDGSGRITEVGQKPQASIITQAITQSETQLSAWLSDNGASSNVINKEQITRTRYDLSYDEGSNILGGTPSILVQLNLRNRVSYTMLYNQEPNPASTVPTHAAATFYTYDIHGNVDTLLQDLKAAMGAVSPGNNRYKKIAYNYDLISGKVNKVSYQPGMLDEFYHQYNYDAENRLTEVYTSHDNLIWEKDARYSYYRHGPLARTILGQQQVQGIDYAYTLQGWLKGVNSTGVQKESGFIGNGEDCGPNSAVDNLQVNARLTPYAPQYVARNSITFNPGFSSNTTDDFTAYINSTLASCVTDGTAGTEIPVPLGGNKFDIGRDGMPSLLGYASQVPTDVYGFNLNYFNGDYKPVSAYETPFASVTTPLPGSTTGVSLYNGNISSMAVNIPKLGDAHLYGYRYDQLNRIVAMDAFTGLDGASNYWTPVATQNYKERVSYDANGNILTYSRNGNLGTAMDVLSYQYPKYANTTANNNAHLVGKMINNRLRYVLDEATSAYTEDIKSNAPSGITTHQNVVDELLTEQAGDNYAYDEIGNLIKDTKEGINNITWNVYGKIQSITKATGTITYTYDASGNRISKTAAGKTTIYVRDATGNVMSVYTADPAVSSGNLIQSEANLYGSSRLGIFEVNRNVQNLVASNYLNNINTFTRGNKFFELSNHLGNVLVTISDRKVGIDRGVYQYNILCPQCSPPPPGEVSTCPPCTNELVLTSSTPDGIIDYYTADVITANDYYPFGMTMPGRKYRNANAKSPRYGFNGKENDNEVKGEGNQIAFEARIYDPRLGRFLSPDPLEGDYPWQTTYAFAHNNPIKFIDFLGMGDPPGTIKQEKNASDNTGFAPNGDLILMGNHRGKNPDKINTRSINLGTEKDNDYRVIYFEVEGGDKWTWNAEKKAYLNSAGDEFSNGLATAIFNKVGMTTARTLTGALQNILNGEPLKDTKMEYDQYSKGGGSGGWAGFVANGVKNGVSGWWDDMRAGGNRRRDAMIGFWQLSSSFAKGSVFDGGFSLTKQYFKGSYSKLIKELELGSSKYPGTTAISKITNEHISALAQNVNDVINKTMSANIKDPSLLQKSIQTQLNNPRFQFIDLLPDGARATMNNAINQLSQKGINVTFPY